MTKQFDDILLRHGNVVDEIPPEVWMTKQFDDILLRHGNVVDELPPEVWMTKQFDDILLRHGNVVYNENTIDSWTKGCILPFPKKGDLRLAKNYRGIILTSITARSTMLHDATA